MCSSFCEKIHNIRALWNDLAFKSFLCSLSSAFYKFGTLPCPLLTWRSDMSRSISGHNMNTSIGLHIRSTSGVSTEYSSSSRTARHTCRRYCALTVQLQEHCCSGSWNSEQNTESNIWATVCLSKLFTMHTSYGLRLLIMRESVDRMNRKVDGVEIFLLRDM